MPSFEWEDRLGYMVAGVDEAGRGPWAGPVVAGAVIILDRNLDKELLSGLDDSKKISAGKREILYVKLFEEEAKGKVSIGIGLACNKEIDELNILQATFLAMKRAMAELKQIPRFALIDGNKIPIGFPCEAKPLIKGDSLSFSISAASIVAKVYRDRLMCEYAKKYPYYSFEKNAGYGTKLHVDGLEAYGITPIHRKSYAPIKKYIK